jgi:hypothetical protein
VGGRFSKNYKCYICNDSRGISPGLVIYNHLLDAAQEDDSSEFDALAATLSAREREVIANFARDDCITCKDRKSVREFDLAIARLNGEDIK